MQKTIEERLEMLERRLAELEQTHFERRWISVLEASPKDHQRVLGLVIKRDTSFFRATEEGTGTMIVVAGKHSDNGAVITHWMPLPEAP